MTKTIGSALALFKNERSTKMQPARLMDRPEDYKRLGLQKGNVEPWEDGMRDNFDAGHFEWWYFDCMLDDGTKVAASFSTKLSTATSMEGNHPAFVFYFNTPDGRFIPQPFFQFTPDQISYSKDGCDVRYGPHSISGNLKEYRIKAEPVNGHGFDFVLKNQVSSWRGDAGYIGMGENDERYFTWLCAAPRGTVEGTITIDGKTTNVTGYGYHDHQWGNIHHAEFLNHWLWARQSIGDYTLLVFDFVLNKEYGYKRIPLMFVQDKDGKVLIENTENVECKVLEEYVMDATQTKFPKVTKYKYENNGKKLEYLLTVKEELEGKDAYVTLTDTMKEISDKFNAYPKYGRYHADGEFTLTDGDAVIHQKGDLIYEFSYIGRSYKELMDTE